MGAGGGKQPFSMTEALISVHKAAPDRLDFNSLAVDFVDQ